MRVIPSSVLANAYMQNGTSSSWLVYMLQSLFYACALCIALATAGGFILSLKAKAPSVAKALSAAAKDRRGQSPGRKPEQPGAVEGPFDEAPEPHANTALAGMSEEEVEAWLSKLGHPDAAKRFREFAISGDALADLTDTDLENMGIAPTSERKNVLALVKAGLKSGPEAAAARSRAAQRKPSGRHGQSPGR
jgi:hypothetical protein